MKIDAHQHFWNLNRGGYDWLDSNLSAIYKNFIPSDLKPLLDATGIDGTILIQADDNIEETQYLLELANKHSWILGVVGWVDLEARNASKYINEFSKDLKFVGVRPMLQDIDDINWMLRPSLKPAIQCLIKNNICFDALIYPKHLKILNEFIALYPDLKVVIDHCAKPQIADKAYLGWADDIKTIAENSKVMCKLSGLVNEASNTWSSKDLQPYIEHILKQFGSSRLMFGSDWPVLNLASNYDAWIKIVDDNCTYLSSEELEALMGKNAEQFYLTRGRGGHQHVQSSFENNK